MLRLRVGVRLRPRLWVRLRPRLWVEGMRVRLRVGVEGMGRLRVREACDWLSLSAESLPRPHIDGSPRVCP